MKDEEKTETPTDKKGSVAVADKIEYSHYGATVAPVYNRGYTISITPDQLVVTIKSYDSVLLTKKRPFTEEQFNEVLQKFKALKKKDEPEQGEIPVGGGSQGIVFYKGDREIFTGNDYGVQARNYSGADIDLSYLVPDMEALVEGTRKENQQQ